MPEKSWTPLIEVMHRQRAVLEEFLSTSEILKEKLHGKDWSELEQALGKMSQLSGTLEALETERADVADQVLVGRDFNSAVAELNPETRRELLLLKQDLKAALTKVRSRTRGLGTYAESRSRLGRDLLQELVPSSRGRLYDHRGRASAAGQDPLLLSRHF